MKALLTNKQTLIFTAFALTLFLGSYLFLLYQARTDLYIQSSGFKLTTWQFLVVALRPIVIGMAWIFTPAGIYLLASSSKNRALGAILLAGGIVAAMATII